MLNDLQRKCLFFILGLLISQGISGQTLKDSLIFSKLKILYHDKALSFNEALEVTKTVPEAFKEMKLAKNSYQTGYILGFIGGGFIGYGIGKTFSEQESNLIFIGTGSGLLLLMLPFIKSYMKHGRTAILIYNSDKAEKIYNR